MKGKAKVVINGEKPRKGAFVIKVNDKTVLELLDLKRPFPKLKALDMDAVAADVIAALDADADADAADADADADAADADADAAAVVSIEACKQ